MQAFRTARLLCILLASGCGLLAAHRTLPAELYLKLRRGQVLDQVWLDPGYDREDGFALGRVVNGTKGRAGEVRQLRRYLKRSAGLRARKGAPCRLKLVIVDYLPPRVRPWPELLQFPGRLTVEGTLKGRRGKLLGAFRITARFGAMGEDARDGVDQVMADLDRELL